MDIIEAIVKIANHDRVIKECEPNVLHHETIHSGHVLRILKAQELLQNEWNELRKTNTKRNRTVSKEK